MRQRASVYGVRTTYGAGSNAAGVRLRAGGEERQKEACAILKSASTLHLSDCVAVFVCLCVL